MGERILDVDEVSGSSPLSFTMIKIQTSEMEFFYVFEFLIFSLSGILCLEVRKMKKVLYSLILGLISFGALSYLIVFQRGENADYSLLFRYALVGLLIFAYAWIIQHMNLKGATIIFSIGVALSIISIATTIGKINEPFVDLGGILMWMISIGMGVVVGLVYEIVRFFYLRHKNMVQ